MRRPTFRQRIFLTARPLNRTGFCDLPTHCNQRGGFIETRESCDRQAARTSGFRSFCSVLRTALTAVRDTRSIQGASHSVVSNTRQILHTSASNQHHGVFLKVVTFTTDVGGHFVTVGQPHPGHLSKRGIRLLGRRGVNTGTYPAFLRTGRERWHIRFDDLPDSWLPD